MTGINTYSVYAIDGDSLDQWLNKTMKPHFPEGDIFYIIPKTPFDAKGENCFFTLIDFDFTSIIDIETFIKSEVIEHTRDGMHHWYARDVCNLAFSLNFLQQSHYHLYYKW